MLPSRARRESKSCCSRNCNSAHRRSVTNSPATRPVIASTSIKGLKRRDVERASGKQLDAENEAELRDQESDAHAFRAGTYHKPDDGQKEQVEQLELLFLRETEDECQRQRDGDELQQGFCRHRKERGRVRANEREWRDHRDSDDVADNSAPRPLQNPPSAADRRQSSG